MKGKNFGEGPRWNGKSCDIEHVIVKVLSGDGFFKWWQPYVGKNLMALKITALGDTFYIYDGDGSGTSKVMNGGGPDCAHRSFENIIELPPDQAANAIITRVEPCSSHQWSKDTVPIFKTRTQYCTLCRSAKVLEEMKNSMR